MLLGPFWISLGHLLVSTWTSRAPFGVPFGPLVGVLAPSGHPLGDRNPGYPGPEVPMGFNKAWMVVCIAEEIRNSSCAPKSTPEGSFVSEGHPQCPILAVKTFVYFLIVDC